MSTSTRRIRAFLLPRRGLDGKPADEGIAMILVIAFSMLMLGIALAVSGSVIRQIVPSTRSENTYSALAAAEAGIFDYRRHLQQDSTYYYADHPDNLAMSGWVDVPGGNADSEYTYRVDKSRVGSAGELTVIAVGRSPKDDPETTADDDRPRVVRTIQAVMSKRSTLDYVYMSDIETPSPDLPGAYSTAANSGGTGKTAQQVAQLLCSRRWYQSGQVDNGSAQGNQRNLNFCQWAGIYSTERLVGRIHTNDVWRLDTTSLTATIPIAENITSSCRSTVEGLQAGEVGCDFGRRYITVSATGLRNNNSTNATWHTTSPSTAYQGDSWRPNPPPDPTGRNPKYASVLDLPTSPALLKKRASDTGCVYSGPTRIRFTSDGYMYVTSPDTLKTNPLCAGDADGTYLGSGTATAPHTARVNLANFEDLVIYVQNVPRPTAADDPDNAWDVNNRIALAVPPATANEPTCKVKSGTNIYPFVIPNLTVDTGEAALFNSPTGFHYKGYPSEYANITSPWYASNCALGDLFVQGKYAGRATIATQNNIVLTSTLAEAGYNTSTANNYALYGKPTSTSDSFLGLVSDKFTYIYRPFTATNTWVGDWKEANSRDPVFNFALLAIDQCFGSQDPFTATSPADPTYGDRNGNIYLWGSLAQKFRCVVGSTGGYNKVYKYDDRLARKVPPGMLELSEEPWGSSVANDVYRKAPYSELTVLQQTVGIANTTPYQLVESTDYHATVADPRVVAGAATWSRNGTQLTVTPTAEGLTVLRYEVTHQSEHSTNTVVESRTLVIWADAAS